MCFYFLLKCSFREETGEFSQKKITSIFMNSFCSLLDFKHKWIWQRDVSRTTSAQYKISRKCGHWEPICPMRTERHEEGNSHFSQLCCEGAYRWSGESNRELLITFNPLYFTGILSEWLANRTCSSMYTVTDLWGALKLKGGKQKGTKLC
jgi:hypothetical protein